jgi:ligand-binding sensor domain-containing protein/two-component sensor histidine kinase
MRSSLRKLTICITALLLFAGFANAMEIFFNQLSIANGLASNFVNCIGQSADGYIWVGTQNGLQRYDGYQFKRVISKNNYLRLPPLPVDQIISVNNPELLLIRMGNSIGIFNTRTFTYKASVIRVKNQLAYKANHKLTQDNYKRTYLLMFGHEILVYNDKTNSFTEEPNFIKYPKNWQPTDVHEDKGGKIWISGTAGLGCFDPATGQFYTSAFNPKKLDVLQKAAGLIGIKHFLIDSKGRFFINNWPAASFKVYLIDEKVPGRTEVSSMPNPKSNYHEFGAFVEKSGLIWGYGTQIFNIFYDDEKAFNIFYSQESSNYGIKVTCVYQIFEDKDKGLWVATDNGLYMMSVVDDHIRNATTSHYFKTASMTNATPLSDNRVLFSSWGNKVLAFGYNSWLKLSEDTALTSKIYKGVPANDGNYLMVWSAIEYPKRSVIWLTCQSGRLIKYNVQTGRSEFLQPSVFSGSTIRNVVADKSGALWFGTQHGYLIKYSENKFKVITDFKSIISKLHCDNKGNIWVGTSGKGLFMLDALTGKILHNYTALYNGVGLSTGLVTDVVQLNDSIMAVACSANLNLLNTRTGKIREFTIYNGLPYSMVTSLQKDSKNNLWMSTIGGICRFDLRTNEFKTFDRKDGLLNTSNLTNLMDQSTRLPNGFMVFCGERSFVIFDPLRINASFTPKDVTITDLRLFDQPLSIDSIRRNGELRLQYDQNFLSISFASLTYGRSNKLRYFYKLKGAGDNWLKADNGQLATFASLAPGKYTFMVRAQNTDGVYSPHISMLNITIVPAFYQTWWFIALMLVLAVLPVYVIYRLRIKRILAVQGLRERVARDLHDDMGSTLTSINILSEVAMRSPAHAGDYLQRITQNSTQMMESMDDIVWSIKPDNDQLHKIIARMREHTASVLEPLDIFYKFESADSYRIVKLDMEDRRNLFLIFKEALNNITKYAQATLVHINIEYADGCLCLKVDDNGKGFNTSIQGDGNGLLNMRKRTELLRGKITIHSSPGEGTSVSIRVPVK